MYDLSIVLCCYQGEKVIFDCLESLAKQKTKQKFEVIIVDDGSRDRTKEIVEAFIKSNCELKNPKFTFFEKENEGLSCTRNYGIERTNSPIIAFIDQDAVALPDWVENIVNEFNKTDSPQIIGGPVELLNSDSKFANFIFNSFQSLEMKSPVAVIGTNMIFSKSLFDGDTLFNPAFVSRGDESYVFAKMRLKYNIVPKQIKTIVVKHETPATLKAWLKTRYQVGLFSAIIDRQLNRKYSVKTLKKMFKKACSISLFIFVVIIALLGLKNPYALILLLFPGYFFYRQYLKTTYSYIEEYRINVLNKAKYKDIMLLLLSSIVNIFIADYGYVKGYFKNNQE